MPMTVPNALSKCYSEIKLLLLGDIVYTIRSEHVYGNIIKLLALAVLGKNYFHIIRIHGR